MSAAIVDDLGGSGGMTSQAYERIVDGLPEDLAVLLLFERLKEVERQNPLRDGERRERVAEHSWQLALGTLLLAEHSPEPIDVAKAALLAVLHDAAEAFVGDTFAFDPVARIGKHEREHAAMRRLHEAHPSSAAVRRLIELWEEYEAQETPEARFVKAMDTLCPIVLNYTNVKQSSWVEHGVRADDVRARLAGVRDVLNGLASVCDQMIDQAQAEGHLA
jgi:putative hydrolase of HD superfamily